MAARKWPAERVCPEASEIRKHLTRESGVKLTGVLLSQEGEAIFELPIMV
jgi:hypothetical protein